MIPAFRRAEFLLVPHGCHCGHMQPPRHGCQIAKKALQFMAGDAHETDVRLAALPGQRRQALFDDDAIPGILVAQNDEP